MSKPKAKLKRPPAKPKPRKWPGAFGKLTVPRNARIRDNGLVELLRDF